MPLQMSAQSLPAWKACFPLHFLGLNVEIRNVVVENGPLKKMSSFQIADPYGQPVVSSRRI